MSRTSRAHLPTHVAWLTALSALTLAVSIPVLIRLSAGTDIAVHAKIAVKLMEAGQWFTYCLWYPLVYVTAGGSAANSHSLRVASVVLLSLAVLATSLLTYRFAWHITHSGARSFAVAALLLLVMPLIDPWRPRSIYLGQVSPTVWHNSTNIFVLPFAILAFTSAIALLRQPSRSRAVVFSVVTTVMLLAKPNFALALLPVMGVVLVVTLWRRGFRLPDSALLVVLAFVLPGITLVAQYLVVFSSTSPGLARDGLAIAPFAAWSLYSPNIAWSLFLSIAGPAVATVALRTHSKWADARWLAWSVLAVAVAQMGLLAETKAGIVMGSGNWFWGAYTAAFVVFMVTAAELAGTRHTEWRKGVAVIAAVLFLGHAVSGAVYAARAGVDGFPITRDVQKDS